MKDLRVNPNLTIQKVAIPYTKLHAYIIDNFLLNTDSVLYFAKNIAYYNAMHQDNSYYPGVRDNMPNPYRILLHDFFQTKILPLILPDQNYTSVIHKSLISLPSCLPADLLTEQKMPHVDSCKNNEYAFVHYLSGKELGGTSIYRYIPDDIVQLTEKSELILDNMHKAIIDNPIEHSGYITQSTSLFEQVLCIDAKVNRLVLYQGNLLHSANLSSKESYSGDTKNGRLSITSFASLSKL